MSVCSPRVFFNSRSGVEPVASYCTRQPPLSWTQRQANAKHRRHRALLFHVNLEGFGWHPQTAAVGRRRRTRTRQQCCMGLSDVSSKPAMLNHQKASSCTFAEGAFAARPRRHICTSPDSAWAVVERVPGASRDGLLNVVRPALKTRHPLSSESSKN